MKSTLIIPEDIVRHKAYYDKQYIITRSIDQFKEHFNISKIKVYKDKPAEAFGSNVHRVKFKIDLPTYSEEYIKCLGTPAPDCTPIVFNGVISTLDDCIHVLHHKDDDPSIIMAIRIDKFIEDGKY